MLSVRRRVADGSDFSLGIWLRRRLRVSSGSGTTLTTQRLED